MVERQVRWLLEEEAPAWWWSRCGAGWGCRLGCSAPWWGRRMVAALFVK